MRKVNKHAHSVHLPDERPALVAYTAPLWLCLAQGILKHSRIGELVVAVVGESGVAYAEGVVEPEVGNRVPNLMEALDPQGRDELAVFESGQGVPTIYSAGKVVRISALEPVYQINLLQGEADTYT